MSMNDNAIVKFDYAALFSNETFMSLMDIEEPEERARKSALLEARAKELGLDKQFRDALKAYLKAEQDIRSATC